MTASHIEREKKTVELMIRLYCRKKEKNTVLCADCEELLRYAHARLDAKSLHSRVLVDITLLQATNMLFCVTNYYLNINVF